MLPLEVAFATHPIARKLSLSFDANRLSSDLGCIREDWWEAHQGPYHNGRWESVSLWAPGGDLREQRSFGKPYAATEALQSCRYISDVLGAFSCQKSRVRLMRLKRGGHIYRHSDPLESISRDLVRLHIPITTSPDVEFIVDGTRIRMCPGEVWHVDVRFKHEVHNLGSSHRVHLVLDLLRNATLQQLLESSTPVRNGFLTGYYLKYCLPGRVRRLFALRN